MTITEGEAQFSRVSKCVSTLVRVNTFFGMSFNKTIINNLFSNRKPIKMTTAMNYGDDVQQIGDSDSQ